MNIITRPLRVLAGACALLMALPAAAQLNLEGRQYVGLSLFSWDSQSARTQASFDFPSELEGNFSFEQTQADASALGVRLQAGVRMTDWLAAELHVAGGGSKKVMQERAAVDIAVTLPADFDPTPFEGLTLDEILNLDPSVFEGVDIDVTEDDTPARVKYRLNQAWGLFLRPNYTFAERFTVSALVGWGYAKADVRSDASWYTASGSGLAYGAAAEFAVLKDKLSVVADYVQYADEDILQIDAISLGVRFRY